jgi:translation elongation factor EF-Tu-like GTPase
MNAPSFLSRVEDTFAITGRGVVVIPGIPQGGKKYFVRIGDTLEVRKPDGQRLLTSVAGIEMVNSPRKIGIPLLLPQEIEKHDVPIGSELWHATEPPAA